MNPNYKIYDLKFFDANTREELGNFGLGEILVEKKHCSYYDYYNSLKFLKPITINLSYLLNSGKDLAYLTGLQDNPKIKRMSYIYDKTKSKRIKKKVNKRILEIVGELM